MKKVTGVKNRKTVETATFTAGSRREKASDSGMITATARLTKNQSGNGQIVTVMARKDVSDVASSSKNVADTKQLSTDSTVFFVTQTNGDWFEVTMETSLQSEPLKSKVDRAWMERVVCWHHEKYSSGSTIVRAVGSMGFGHDPEENGWEHAFVYGGDRAPNGQLWRDVFAACESWTPGHYEIKDLSVFQLSAK